VVLIEVARKAYLASIVPVIVNAILNEHQIVVDIVAFVNKGDFPRSRLGEKQRGKILAGWVSRKMRTIAQFAIKDMDREVLGPPGTSSGDQSSGQGAHDGAGADHHRTSTSSFRSSSGGGPPPPHGTSSSLRNVEPAPQILEQRELEQQQHAFELGNRTPGLAEMPAGEHGTYFDNDPTPTKDYAEPRLQHAYELPDFDQFGRDEGDEGSPPPAVGPKPGFSHHPPERSASGSGSGYGSGYGQEYGGGGVQQQQQQQQQQPPQIRLPGVDGRESLYYWELRPSTGGGYGNKSGRHGGGRGEDDWMTDAYMSMNLAGTLGGGEAGRRG
jgi:hypothetical protein